MIKRVRKVKGAGCLNKSDSPMFKKTNLCISYHKQAEQSSVNLKEKIGELLLYLQNPLSQHQRQKTWRIFELKLRQYLDLKVRGVPV